MRDKQLTTCLSNLDCVTVGGIISVPHPVLRAQLSAVLESDAPPKFSLSARAAAGILRRAEKRGKALPPALKESLERSVASGPKAAAARPETKPIT